MPPEGRLTPLTYQPGFLARVGTGIRYAIRGVAPDDWFGPLQPMEPVAPVFSEPRRFDYRSGLNIQYQPRGEEGVSFPQMRALADSYDLLRLVIETRKDQVERLRWNIRPKTVTGGKTPTAASDPRVAALESFFRKPDGTPWVKMIESGNISVSPAIQLGRMVQWVGPLVRTVMGGNPSSSFLRYYTYTAWADGPNHLAGAEGSPIPVGGAAPANSLGGPIDMTCDTAVMPEVPYSNAFAQTQVLPAGDPP